MKCKTTGMAALLATALLSSASVADTWEETSWREAIHYRSTFETEAAMQGTLYVAAADSYEVYFNGALVGSDSSAARMTVIPVDVEDGDNEIAVMVVNHGGGGSGLVAAVRADEADSLQVVETTTDRSMQTWYWSDAAQEGTDWTTEDVDDEEGWSVVQEGTMDVAAVQGMVDPAPLVVAGFPGGVDVGSVAGGIQLKRINGENLAIGKPSNRIEVVDGDLKSAWQAPVNALNFNARIDLQVRRNIERVRVITKGRNDSEYESNSLRGYSVQISDDQIRWSEVGVVHDIQDYVRSVVDFRATWTRYLRVVIVEITAVSQPQVAEMEVYGTGHTDRGTFLSDILDLGLPGAAKNLGRVNWQATVPERTALTMQFRSGDSQEDFADEEAGWSAPFAEPSIWFPAEEPAALIQYRVSMSSLDDTRSPVFDGVTIDYSGTDVAASSSRTRSTPNRVPMGRDTTFTCIVDLDFEDGDLGVERLEIMVPSAAVLGDVVGATASEWASTEDRLSLTFASPLTEDVQLEIPFVSRTYATSHKFRTYLYAPGSEDPLNAAQNTDADPVTEELYSWNLLATTSMDDALTQVRAEPAVVTPNGDDINDHTVIGFVLAKVNTPVDVDIHIYDLSGRSVRQLSPSPLAAGSYTGGVAAAPGYWDGTDDAGNVVPPGIYLFRVRANLDTGDEMLAGTVAVAY